ncbi:MAG: aldose 1-epimerase family protein [Sedimentisphaeraceae bacterium JB056]
MINSISNDFLSVDVKTEGAELCSLKQLKNNKEFLWTGDAKYWNGQSPILFPVVGRIRKQGLVIDGQIFDMPKHGFARKTEFELIEHCGTNLRYRIADSDYTYSVYPYKFLFDVEYKLVENCLEICFTVTNSDEKVMCFSLGAHPGFNCPLDEDEKFSDYYIEFDRNETADCWRIVDDLLAKCEPKYLENQDLLTLDRHMFKDDALVFKQLNSSRLYLCSRKRGRRLEIDFAGFKHLGLWTKSEDAPFICIEPWLGYDDVKGFEGDITEKEGIELLNPGKQFSCSYSIKVLG